MYNKKPLEVVFLPLPYDRYNMDSLSSYSEEQIWNVLEKDHLKSKVTIDIFSSQTGALPDISCRSHFIFSPPLYKIDIN